MMTMMMMMMMMMMMIQELPAKMAIVMMMIMMIVAVNAADTNDVFDPCLDAKVQRSDGFSFGLAFSDKDSFFLNQVQLSPCDTRLPLVTKTAQLAVFRPKVDELSLLTINSTTFDPALSGGYMVAFAGRKYAARSIPVMITDNNMTITSFTLVIEFQKGTLVNLFWKKFGCKSCPKDFTCLGGQDCAIPRSKCRGQGGSADCNPGIQLAFSGTDKNLEALNSWYEMSNIRQYSLYALYSDLRESILTPLSGLW